MALAQRMTVKKEKQFEERLDAAFFGGKVDAVSSRQWG
jgi:hypothetical protein